jgi:hypothetical protein
MPRVPPFHSVNEARRPPVHRVYHENDACPLGRAIQQWECRAGTGGHRLCKDCERLNQLEPPKSSTWL